MLFYEPTVHRNMVNASFDGFGSTGEASAESSSINAINNASHARGSYETTSCSGTGSSSIDVQRRGQQSGTSAGCQREGQTPAPPLQEQYGSRRRSLGSRRGGSLEEQRTAQPLPAAGAAAAAAAAARGVITASSAYMPRPWSCKSSHYFSSPAMLLQLVFLLFLGSEWGARPVAAAVKCSSYTLAPGASSGCKLLYDPPSCFLYGYCNCTAGGTGSSCPSCATTWSFPRSPT